MTEIDILIHPDGTVEMEVKGCAGPECEALTRDDEARLGPVTQRRRKAEFYQRAPTRVRERLQHG